MKTSVSIALTAALMNQRWQPAPIAIPVVTHGYSYPITNNRRTGKAAERRAAKQRRRARV